MKNLIKTVSAVCIIMLLGIFLTSCGGGSRPYKEMKSALTELQSKVKKAESEDDLQAVASEYQQYSSDFQSKFSPEEIGKVSEKEKEELSKLTADFEKALQAKMQELGGSEESGSDEESNGE